MSLILLWKYFSPSTNFIFCVKSLDINNAHLLFLYSWFILVFAEWWLINAFKQLHHISSSKLAVSSANGLVSSPSGLTWLHSMNKYLNIKKKSSSNTSFLVFIIITVWGCDGISVCHTFNLPLGTKQVICSIPDSRAIKNNSTSPWVELKSHREREKWIKMEKSFEKNFLQSNLTLHIYFR